MIEQLLEMGTRLTALREIKGFSPEDLSEKLDMTVEEYLAYEKGEKDFSFSFMYNVASILEVDVFNLMSGQSPKLSNCAIVRKGHGYHIKKDKEYEYKHLAYTFKDKKAEPFLVTVMPNLEENLEFHSHEGQEFNYVVSGKISFYIGDLFYELEKGDSVYFDSSIPHAERASGDKVAKFVAVVMGNL
jgi:quercetin dioxygenase-like cupin family protein